MYIIILEDNVTSMKSPEGDYEPDDIEYKLNNNVLTLFFY